MSIYIGHSFQEEQFISWMEKLNGNQSYDDILILRGAFETFDKDKDGFINKVCLLISVLLDPFISLLHMDTCKMEAVTNSKIHITNEETIWLKIHELKLRIANKRMQPQI